MESRRMEREELLTLLAIEAELSRETQQYEEGLRSLRREIDKVSQILQTLSHQQQEEARGKERSRHQLSNLSSQFSQLKVKLETERVNLERTFA